MHDTVARCPECNSVLRGGIEGDDSFRFECSGGGCDYVFDSNRGVCRKVITMNQYLTNMAACDGLDGPTIATMEGGKR